MKKIHDWEAEEYEDFYDQPEVGFELEDGNFLLFEKLPGTIMIRILVEYHTSDSGWWVYDPDDILLDRDTGPYDECWEDMKMRPEYYLTEAIL